MADLKSMSEEAALLVAKIQAIRAIGELRDIEKQVILEDYKGALYKSWTLDQEKSTSEWADWMVICNEYSKFFSREEALDFCTRMRQEFLAANIQ